MGAVNPNLITQLIFQKRPVQNVLQQLAFAINARAGVSQVVTRRVALCSSGGPFNAGASFDTDGWFPTSDTPAAASDYTPFLPLGSFSATGGATASAGVRGATRLPSGLTGSSMTLEIGWQPIGLSSGDIWRFVEVFRCRPGAGGTSVASIVGSALAVSGVCVTESLAIPIGSVAPGDFLVVQAAREPQNAGDTYSGRVVVCGLDLVFQETLTLAS